MSPSTIKPSLILAAAALTAAVPVAASAHGTCRPAAVVKSVHKARPKPVRAVRVRYAAPCHCATRTVASYVEAPPPPVVRRVVVYRTRPEPVFVHAPYVDEVPVVYRRYEEDRYPRYGYAHHHRYARHDAYYARWHHYDRGYE